jgi:hypothetical protein
MYSETENPPLVRPDEYPPATRGTVIVWGMLASSPFGGMVWQIYHYLVPLRRMGFDVWYVEDSNRYLYDLVTYNPIDNHLANTRRLAIFLDQVGLGDRWIFGRSPANEVCVGARDRKGLNALYREAIAAFNICGAQEFHDEYTYVDCLIYVETDPVQKQVDVARGERKYIDELAAYDFLFTYGENLGNDDCLVPIEHFRWRATRPPVCIDLWQSLPPSVGDAAMTSVANWKHKGKDVIWKGETWRWSKHIEFMKFIDVPRDAALPMELAVGAISDDDRALLKQSGWRSRASSTLADPHDYRRFIQGSLGEFTVAKEQYVKPRSGWFSDRSVCYLAAGRPVVTQDTAFRKFVPAGEGLFSYTTREEALEALQAIADDYAFHADKALEVAREYFDADKVVRNMLETAGLL